MISRRWKCCNKRFTRSHALLVIIVLLASLQFVSGQSSLSGNWSFRLDPDDRGLNENWFETDLKGTLIQLPGSCEERGFGNRSSIRDSFRLTRKIRYEGKAWYQREIEIPTEWKEKRVELFLERCHWVSAVWLDGKPFGTQNSLSAPHLYDLGMISKGRHVLTISIDNSYGKLPIGTWGFAITDDTQGNWNGIIGRIELRATDPVWIIEAQVFSDHLQVKIGNAIGLRQQGRIRGRNFSIPIGGTTIDLDFKPTRPDWDEFSPSLHTLRLELQAAKYRDQVNIRYGNRRWSTRKGQFVLNGRPVMVRGRSTNVSTRLRAIHPWINSHGCMCCKFASPTALTLCVSIPGAPLRLRSRPLMNWVCFYRWSCLSGR